jgi:hypothetical protein
MKKFIGIWVILFFCYSCSKNNSGLNSNGSFYNFITLEGKIFKDGEVDFYPMVMNYNIEVDSYKSDSGLHFFATPKNGYHPNYGKNEGESPNPWGSDPVYNHKMIKSHLIAIKDMGFNAIRLTGFTTTDFFDNGFTTWSNIDLSHSTEGNRNIDSGLTPLIKELIGYAEESGLRVILLLSAVETQPENQLNFYSKIAKGLADEKGLMAYDVYNEPRYFDKGDYTKKQTIAFVESYNKAIKDNSPKHLTTIGLSHYKIMEEWDPEMMDVDFLSFHVYPYGSRNLSWLERFDAKLYWMSKTIKKPWIIGETGLNTDPECDPINLALGTYEDQLEFMHYSLEKNSMTTSSGYSWWSFQDTRYNFKDTCAHTSYYGMVNVDKGGFFINSKGDTILGNLKHKMSDLPFADFVKNVGYKHRNPGEFSITKPNGYYNIDNLPEHNTLTGKVIDEQGKPIEGANITMLNTKTKGFYSTFSKEDGSFDLKTGWSDVFKSPWLVLKIAAVRMENFSSTLENISTKKESDVGTITLKLIQKDAKK